MQTFIKLMDKDGISFRMLTINGEADFEFIPASGPDSFPVLRISKGGDYNNREIDLVGDTYIMNNEGKTISKTLHKDLVRSSIPKQQVKDKPRLDQVAATVAEAQRQPQQPTVDDVMAERQKLMGKALWGGGIKGAEPKITFNKNLDNRVLVMDANWKVEKEFSRWVIEQKVENPNRLILAGTGGVSGSEVYVALSGRIVKVVTPTEILDVCDMDSNTRILMGLDPDTNKLNGLRAVAWYEMHMEWTELGNRFEVTANKTTVENKHLYQRARRQLQLVKHPQLGWGVHLNGETFKPMGKWSHIDLKKEGVFASNEDLLTLAEEGEGKAMLEMLEENQPDFPQEKFARRLIHVKPVGENDLDFGFEWDGRWYSLGLLGSKFAEGFVFCTTGEVLAAMDLFGLQSMIEQFKVVRCVLPAEFVNDSEHLISEEARRILGNKAILGHMSSEEVRQFVVAMETALGNPQTTTAEVCVVIGDNPEQDQSQRTSYLFINGGCALAIGNGKVTLPGDLVNRRTFAALEKGILESRTCWKPGFHWFSLVKEYGTSQVRAYRIDVTPPLEVKGPQQLLIVGDRGYGIYLGGKWFPVNNLTPGFIKDQKIWASAEALQDLVDMKLNLPDEVMMALRVFAPINPEMGRGINKDLLRPSSGNVGSGYIG